MDPGLETRLQDSICESSVAKTIGTDPDQPPQGTSAK